MNDKERLLKNYTRMCLFHNCYECPIWEKDDSDIGCNRWVYEHPEEAVEIIEKWGSEHPIKIRQDVFLEHYPDAAKFEDIIMIKPCYIEPKEWMNVSCLGSGNCVKCKTDYWSQEIEEEVEE